MARLWYGGTPADFVIAQGANADIVDSEGAPTADDGAAVLLPLVAVTFDVYTDAALSTVTTNLLDAAGSEIDDVSQSTDFDTRGTIPRFQGPDDHEGPLWLSVDGINGYRLEPESGPLWVRSAANETAINEKALGTLADVNTTDRSDGRFIKWVDAEGEHVYVDAPGTGTVTSVNGVPPTAGDVELVPGDIGAAPADVVQQLKDGSLVMVLQEGTGYPAHPAWAVWKGFVGTPDPGVAAKKIWFKPKVV